MDFTPHELAIIAMALRCASQVEAGRPPDRARRGFTPPPRVPPGDYLALAERIEWNTAKGGGAGREG